MNTSVWDMEAAGFFSTTKFWMIKLSLNIHCAQRALPLAKQYYLLSQLTDCLLTTSPSSPIFFFFFLLFIWICWKRLRKQQTPIFWNVPISANVKDSIVNNLYGGSPIPRPWSGTGPWPVNNQAAQQGVSAGKWEKLHLLFTVASHRLHYCLSSAFCQISGSVRFS